MQQRSLMRAGLGQQWRVAGFVLGRRALEKRLELLLLGRAEIVGQRCGDKQNLGIGIPRGFDQNSERKRPRA